MRIIFLVFFAVLLSACSGSSNNPEVIVDSCADMLGADAPECQTKDARAFTGSEHVKVFKSTGELQCEPETGTSLEEMRFELTDAGIDVLCSQTEHDGLAHTQVCGASRGRVHIYTIIGTNLEDAVDLGFANVTTLTEYADIQCTP